MKMFLVVAVVVLFHGSYGKYVVLYLIFYSRQSFQNI